MTKYHRLVIEPSQSTRCSEIWYISARLTLMLIFIGNDGLVMEVAIREEKWVSTVNQVGMVEAVVVVVVVMMVVAQLG